MKLDARGDRWRWKSGSDRALVWIMLVAGFAGRGLGAAEAAATAPGTAPVAPVTLLVQVPFATVTPRLDAAANDPAWVKPGTITGLPLQLNVSKKLAPIPTEVRLLWDAKFLYVRFICEDNELYTPVNGRDAPLYNGDVVEVFLDPKGDHRQYFEFEVNPDNSVLDAIHLVTGDVACDSNNMLTPETFRDYWSFLSWSAENLRTAACRIETKGTIAGWIADFAIPAQDVLKRTGRQTFQPMNLRANFVRYERRCLEGAEERQFIPMAWGKSLGGCPHTSPGAMGTLELLAPPAPTAP